MVGLGRKDHQFHRSCLSGLIGGRHRGHPEIAENASNLQAFLAKGGKMRSASDKGHLMTSLRKQSPVIAANPTGSHDRDLHKSPFVCLLLMSRPFL